MPPNDVLPLPESNPTGTQVDDRLREVRVPLQVRGDTAGVRQPKDGLHLCSADQVIRIYLLSHVRQSIRVDSTPDLQSEGIPPTEDDVFQLLRA